MKRAATIAATLPLVLVLNGCAGTSWKVAAKCKTGGECEVSGEISGKVEKQGGKKKSLLERMVESAATFDAALFSIDVSSSAANVPATGLVTIQLVDSYTGAIQTSREFAWVKSGNDLVLADPDTVNNWAMAEGGTADSTQYFLHPFYVAQESGANTLQVSAQYEGTTYASETTSWNSGGGCREVRCHQQ